MSRPTIENTIPVLAVADLARSVDFYRRTLGFEVEWDAGGICSVGRDECSIMLQVREPVVAGVVWIGLEDDSLFDAVQAAGATVVQQPANQPWAYEMKIVDPDGNILWLGTEPRVE